MSGVMVTGPMVRKPLLDLLDSIGSNGLQHRLLINLTPEVDSLVEKIAALSRPPHLVPGEVLRDLLRDCQQLIDLNRGEGDSTRSATEVVDRLARDAEHAARNGQRRPGVRVIDLAVELRPLLATMCLGHKADSMAYVRACRDVLRIIDRTATDRLLCKRMQTELGKRSFELLSRLVADHAESETS